MLIHKTWEKRKTNIAIKRGVRSGEFENYWARVNVRIFSVQLRTVADQSQNHFPFFKNPNTLHFVNIFSIYWRVFGRATYKAGSTKVNICGSWWVQGKFGCPSTNVNGLDFVDWILWKVVTQVGFHLLAKMRVQS